MNLLICDALSDLVPFVQIKKREKQPWSSVTFSKIRTLNCMKFMYLWYFAKLDTICTN